MKIVKLRNNLNLQNPLELEIEEGEKVLLQGPSGIGKTVTTETILDISVYRGSKIKVIYNGLNKYSKIGYSTQEAWTLGGKLIDEVALYEKNELNKLCLKKACYATCISNEFSYKELLKHKWNLSSTKNLSSGELKRLSIARVLYLDPKFVVLDEPTASVQQELKELMIKRVFETYKTATILVISHDKYLKSNFDKVVTWK